MGCLHAGSPKARGVWEKGVWRTVPVGAGCFGAMVKISKSIELFPIITNDDETLGLGAFGHEASSIDLDGNAW